MKRAKSLTVTPNARCDMTSGQEAIDVRIHRLDSNVETHPSQWKTL